MPLLAQARGYDNQYTTFALGPLLANDKPGFDGFAQADLIGQNSPHRQRRAEGKKGGLHLMRVQVDLGIHQGPGELLRAVGSESAG